MGNNLSSSLEDYLEVIYIFIEKQNSVKAIDISRTLGVSKASVTEALKKLNEKKLINYEKYNSISLTQEGRLVASDIINKHNSLSNFFIQVLGADNFEAQEIACKIEHVISQKMLKRVNLFTKFYNSIPEEIRDKFNPSEIK